LIAQARLGPELTVEPLMQKDSADISTEDGKLIYDRCVAAPEEKIVITHGTDTLTETTKFLGEKSIGNKTIVLTGSFIPFSQPNSDALFNFGYAIAVAQTNSPGVWLALNGEIFEWNHVRKNKEQGRIERMQ
jgi:L-asparaginase